MNQIRIHQNHQKYLVLNLLLNNISTKKRHNPATVYNPAISNNH